MPEDLLEDRLMHKKKHHGITTFVSMLKPEDEANVELVKEI